MVIKNFFSGDLPSPYSFKQELILWKREWQGVTSPPSTIENTLTEISVSFYPNCNMAQILRLTLMLPVSAATVDKSSFRFEGDY